MTKRSLYNTGRRDANEDGIMELLKARNIRVTSFRPGDGADKLIWIDPMEVWEIKNPDQPPSKRKLTDDELEAQEYCARVGIPYIVIETIEDANERLNNYFAVRINREPMEIVDTEVSGGVVRVRVSS